jgi:hypothetical protein
MPMLRARPKPATEIVPGDLVWNSRSNTWVRVAAARLVAGQVMVTDDAGRRLYLEAGRSYQAGRRIQLAYAV